MSNLIQELQDGLKQNNKLYKQIKNEEIINLIKNYKKNFNDYKIYELYFNNKCINDYITFLISNINNEIEKILIKDNFNEILEKKLEMLFKKYKNNLNKLIKQFNVNNQDLFKNIKQIKILKQKIDIKKELNKNYTQDEENYNNITNNINNIIIEELNKYIDTNKKSDFLIDYINYIIRINKRLLNMKISNIEYNKYLMNKLTENDYNNIDNMIEDNVSNEYINNEQLSFMILKYKNIKNETFESLILEFPDDIDNKFIEKYRNLEDINIDNINIIIKYHLFIEIIEICDQPQNDLYLKYLKDIYMKNNMKKQYDDIINKNQEIKEMLLEYEDEELIFSRKIIKNILNNKNYEYDILKRSIDEDMSEEQYINIKNEYNMIENINNKKDEQFEILDSYITSKLSNKIQNMIDYNLSKNINELKKNMKVSNEDDDMIRQQMEMYEINKRKKSEYIYVSVNNIFENNNIIDLFDFYRKLEKKLELLDNKKFLNDLDIIIQNTLSQIFEHYLKAINHYKTLDDRNDRLYYELNNDNEIRVYVKDQILELLEYVLKNINETSEYIYKHTIKHLFEYKYYNIILEIEETISEKLDTDIIMIRYKDKINLINNIFNKDYNKKEIKELNDKLEKRMDEIMKEKFDSYDKYKSYNKIKNLNDKYQILSEKEMKYLKKQLEILSFIEINKINKRNDEDKISLLKFIKLFIKEVDDKMKDKKINIYNENNKFEKKQEYDMVNDLKLLMKGEIKFINNKKEKVEKIYVNNIIDIGTKIEDIDLTELTIKKFQNIYNQKSNIDKKESIIKESINNTLNMLEKIFNKKYNQKQMIIKNMLDEKNKLIIISKKYTKKLNYDNIYKKLNEEIKNLYDIVKYLTILYYIDFLINSNIDIQKQIEIPKNKENNKSLINKNIYIIESKKISKIIKESDNKFHTNNEILDRKDFLLLSSLKNKVCKIIKGVYKGNYGRIIDIKGMNYITKQMKINEQVEKKYFINLINELNNKKMSILNNSDNQIIDKTELSVLEKYRKNLNKNNLEEKYVLNIMINPKLNKIISDNEKKFINDYRKERIQEIDYQTLIYKNKLNKKKENKTQYIVKINEGEKIEKNIYLNMNEIKLNTDLLVNKEIIEVIKNKTKDKKINFTSLYDLSKYLFEYLNFNIDDKLEYFTNIYNDSIDIYNYNKINKMNKLLIEIKLEEKIRKMNKNIKILSKKESLNKINEKEYDYLKKLLKLLKNKQNELNKLKLDINNEDLYLYYNKSNVDKYNDDLYIENNVIYFKKNKKLLEKDLNEIKSIKIKIQKDEQNIEQKMNIQINKIINDFQNYINDILEFDYNQKIKLIKYVRGDILDDEEDFDEDELELELELEELMKKFKENDIKKEKINLSLEDDDTHDDYIYEEYEI